MNFKMIERILSRIIIIEALFMIPALLIGIFSGETKAMYGFLLTYAVMLPVILFTFFHSKNVKRGFYARDGLVCVALCWFIISLFGCLPFWFSGEIPHFIDALFEMVSGFTTTGASVVGNVEALSKSILYWRSFSHWLGGMGVLVFVLAVTSFNGRNNGYTVHLLRAESPGPSVSKIVPRMRDTAKILYMMYIILTVLNFILLMFGGMSVFEAVCTAFGTAGTGGFGIKNSSIAGYNSYIQIVTTVFMILFGVNFTCYYFMLQKNFKAIIKNEELQLYVGIIIGSVIAIAINIRNIYPTVGETVKHSAFQVASIITTTGYSTADFDLWPSFSKTIILFLMIVGACAGSTGGGFKCGRVLLVFKVLRRNIKKLIHPQKIQVVKIDKEVVNEGILENANAYLAAYVIILALSVLVISIDDFSITTNLSAVLSCFNNIGPGLEKVGPSCNFSSYGALSKCVLIFDMLAGRLEIFPLLALFSKSSWTHKK